MNLLSSLRLFAAAVFLLSLAIATPSAMAQGDKGECLEYDARANCIRHKQPTGPNGFLRVKGDRDTKGARVSVDGTERGTAPLRLQLAPGNYRIKVTKPGFESYEKTVKIRRGRNTFINPNLAALTTLEFTVGELAAVAGAEIVIDGKAVGTVPAKIQVTAGPHNVVISKKGFKSWSTQVDLKKGGSMSIPVQLNERPEDLKGKLEVKANIDGAQVYVAGTYRGIAPTGFDVNGGDQTVEVRKDGYQEWAQTVRVIPGGTVEVTANMTRGAPKPGTIAVSANMQGADVYLNDTLVGKTPVTQRDLKPGIYRIKVTAPKHTEWTRQVIIKNGNFYEEAAQLQPLFGIIEVTGAKGATITVDDKKVGKVPKTLEIDVGPHYLVVTKPGYEPFRRQFYAQPGSREPVKAVLRPLGGIEVNTPSGFEGKVFIDNAEVGKTPHKEKNLEPGEYLVTVQIEGRGDYTRIIVVEPGRMVKVNAYTNDQPTATAFMPIQPLPEGEVGFFAGRERASSLRAHLAFLGGTPDGIDNTLPGVGDGTSATMLEFRFGNRSGWWDSQFGLGVAIGDGIDALALSAKGTPEAGMVNGEPVFGGIGASLAIGANLFTYKRSDAYSLSLINLSAGAEGMFYFVPFTDADDSVTMNGLLESDTDPEFLWDIGIYIANTFQLGCRLDLRAHIFLPLANDLGAGTVLFGASLGYYTRGCPNHK